MIILCEMCINGLQSKGVSFFINDAFGIDDDGKKCEWCKEEYDLCEVIINDKIY